MKTTKFKNSEIGPIPEEWEVRPFAESFTLMRNNTYARENLTDLPGRVANVHYGDVLIKYGSVLDFARDDVPYLKPGVKANKDLLHNGDLIFADTAEDETVGKAVEVQGLNGRMAVSGLHTVVCRPNEDLFAPRYLGYYINSAAYHNQLLPLITGTKVSSVSRAGFASTYVVVPPLAEQEAIAGALADVDELLAAMTTLIEKKRAIKQGAMQELLEVREEDFSHGERGEHGDCFKTGLTGFTGLRDDGRQNPVNPVNPVEKTDAPRRRLAGFTGAWVERRLGDCGKFSKGAGISRAQANTGKIPAVRYGELYTTHNDYIKQFESFISEEVAQASVRLNRGDIVFACSGETKEEIGKCAAFLGDEVAYAGGDLIIFSPDNEYDSLFLGFALNTPYCASQKAAAGQGDAVVHIRRDTLEELVVRIPPALAEQKAIAEVLADMDAEIAVLEAKRAKYEQIKQGMMQELLTGKVRLA